jgi:phage baseplate assembly protein W
MEILKYKGFSTVSSDSQKKFVLVNHKLIIQDLLNAIYTPRGSRVMQPNFGCIVWEYLFDNLEQSQIQDIATNITGIINNDPRISLNSLDITPYENILTITISIQFLDTNEIETLILNLSNETTVDY